MGINTFLLCDVQADGQLVRRASALLGLLNSNIKLAFSFMHVCALAFEFRYFSAVDLNKRMLSNAAQKILRMILVLLFF